MEEAPSVVPNAKSRRGMAPPGCLPIPLQGNTIWNSRIAQCPFFGWRGIGRYTPEPRRCLLRISRPPGGLQGGHLRGDPQGICHEGTITGLYGLFCLHGLARRNRRKKGKVCGKLDKAKHALAPWQHQNGDPPPLCHGDRAGRSFSVVRYKEWLPPFPTGTRDARLVYFPLRWAVFQMRGPALRLGQVAKVVHAANGPATEATPLQITLPLTGMHRRFPGRAGASWATGYPQGLPPSSKTNTAVAGRVRPHSSSHEGRVERSNSDRAFGSCGRFEANEIFLSAAQDRKGTIYGHKTAAASPCGSALCVLRPARVFRRRVCFPHLGHAIRSFLHSISVLGHGQAVAKRTQLRALPDPVDPPKHLGPSPLADTHLRRKGWTGNTPAGALSHSTHRRRRHGVRGYPWPGYGTRSAWPLGGPSCVGMEGPRARNFASKTPGHTLVAHRATRPATEGAGTQSSSGPLRQPCVVERAALDRLRVAGAATRRTVVRGVGDATSAVHTCSKNHKTRQRGVR